MEAILKHAAFLSLLNTARNYQRELLIRTATNEQLKVLCEILLNIVKGNISLAEKDIKLIQKKSDIVRALLRKTTSKRNKRRLFQTNSDLVKIIARGIAQLLPSVFSNNDL